MSDQLPHDEELRTLYRKLPADEPRAEIDDAILAAARAQIHDRQRRRFLSRLGWAVPLAAAASIAVTLMLIRVAPEQASLPAPRLDEETMQTKAAKSVDRPAARQETAAAPVSPQRPAPSSAPPPRAAETAPPPPPAAARAPSPPAAATASEQKRKVEARKDGANANAPSVVAPARPASPPAPASGGAAYGESLKGLGYITGSEPSPKEAAPPASRDAASPPVSAQAQPAAPIDNVRSTVEDELRKANEARAKSEVTAELHAGQLADKKDALAAADLDRRRAEEADAASGRAKPEAGTLPGALPVVPASWPFRLEAGLDRQESCRRIVTSLKSRCEFSDDTATVSLPKPQKIGSGEFAGAKVTRVRLIFDNGKLWKISLRLEGYATEQVLVAPTTDPAPSAPPP